MIPEIKLSDYDYNLPKSRIAAYPATNRDESKLLYYNVSSENINSYKFRDIATLLPRDSHLVLNSTKVIAARIMMLKPTGGKAELLCVEPLLPSTDPQITMAAVGSCHWECIVGGRNIIEGMTLKQENTNSDISLNAKIISKHENKAVVEFSWQPQRLPFSEIINHEGIVPLPPYIRRDAEESDKERYQTVYAESQGSVAAPTAGLHFTDAILNEIKEFAKVSRVLLHVGPGTFTPVEHEYVALHKMHREQIFVDKSMIEDLVDSMNNNRPIIAVGTTSMRTLESLYIFGLKLLSGYEAAEAKLEIRQWDGFEYTNSGRVASVAVLEQVLEFMQSHNLSILSGNTELFIVPGYEFGLCRGIVTNFHLPKSTLLMLIAAFIGKDNYKKIYDYALERDFRFLSYGDSSLLIK